MAGSYRNINYSLRPAKAVERRMFCDIFQRLYPFGRIESYRYIGFGSLYFTDFQLFHRALGLQKMLSIEKDAYAKEAFEFNRPYRCVELDFRPSGQVLSSLTWDDKTIAWLDYDGTLNTDVLSDVRTVCARAPSGSVLFVSVNVQGISEPNEQVRGEYSAVTGMTYNLDDYRLWAFRRNVGTTLPTDITGKDLRGRGVASVTRQMISNAIEESLSARNATSFPEQKATFQQIVNVLYSDGAKMMTVGGVIVDTCDQQKFDACAFDELHFVRTDKEPYEIKVPCLTLKEVNHLNMRLPHAAAEEVNLPGVPQSDISHYAEIYRYFPAFAEAIFV